MHYFYMSKWFIALLLLATPVFAQERPTAYEAMRTVGTQLKRDYVNHVMSVTGKNGDPQPETWTILIEDPGASGGVREVEVSNGKIVSERTPLRSTVENSLGTVIDTSKLNLDSSGAYTLARQTATKSHVIFATTDYALRVDGRGNPIWKVALRRQDGEPTGTIFIGANHGTVTRTEGLFAGGDQAAQASQSDEANREKTYESDTNVVARTFHQVGEDVKSGFNKVSRSFVDFFKDK
jgi:hypothetical protein